MSDLLQPITTLHTRGRTYYITDLVMYDEAHKALRLEFDVTIPHWATMQDAPGRAPRNDIRVRGRIPSGGEWDFRNGWDLRLVGILETDSRYLRVAASFQRSDCRIVPAPTQHSPSAQA